MTAHLIEVETGRIVVPQVIVVTSLWGRSIGLIGKRGLDAKAGLWLEPCNGIHTFGLRFALDVVAFDKAGLLLKTWENVRPFRVCLPVSKGHTVLELSAGTLASLSLQRDLHYRLHTDFR